MEADKSWTYCYTTDMERDVAERDSYARPSRDNSDGDTFVSLDLFLPDDLLERILSHLPIASIFRAGSVCRKWHDIVSSKLFLSNFSYSKLRKPWYYMFTSSDEHTGYAYDLILRKWFGINLPCIETSNWSVASSCGLVCSMDNDSRKELSVCNPITKCSRTLCEPPGLRFSDYSALAIKVDPTSKSYCVAIVKSKQVPDNFLQWDLSIQVYNSESMIWVSLLSEVWTGWRGGNESVICNGILYFLIYSTGIRILECRHALVTCNLSNRSSNSLLSQNFVPVPCSLTCGRLMNMNEKLVLVGGIGRQDRPDVVRGIGIWVLNETKWEEMARMPQCFFQGFGELDEVFASSGADDIIYIQSYGGPMLLTFDMSRRQWKWSQKFPVTKRFPLQLFTGFCFEPRLDVDP